MAERRQLQPSDVIGISSQQPVDYTQRTRMRLLKFLTFAAPYRYGDFASFPPEVAEDLVSSGICDFATSS